MKCDGCIGTHTLSFHYRREKRNIPFIISACIREVERRGMYEIGVYRVSGSASDLAKLKKSFETSKSKSYVLTMYHLVILGFFFFFIHSQTIMKQNNCSKK